MNNFKRFSIPSDSNPASNPFDLLPLTKENTPHPMDNAQTEASLHSLCERASICIKKAASASDIKERSEQFSWAVYLLEKSISLVRNMAIENNCDPLFSVYESEEGYFPGIYAYVEDGILTFDLPILLPKRNSNQKTDYYVKGIEHALQEVNLCCVPHEGCLCIVFLHCYDRHKYLREIRDHDHIEIKWIIDALNTFLLTEDNPLYLNHYSQSTLDERNHTLIYLVPANEIGDFLNQHYESWSISL